jgi:hypothetical protein
MSGRHTRRSFLVQALAGLGLGACGGDRPQQRATSHAPDGGTADDASAPPDEAGGASAKLYFAADDLEAVYALGMRYVAALAIPLTAEAVREAARSTVGVIETAPSDSAALTTLAERVRQEFSTDVTFDLDGWVLSRTELDLCALCLFA